MSHAWGQVRFDSDGLVMHYEYSGTADLAANPLFATVEEYREGRGGPGTSCKCGVAEPCAIATMYGRSFWWRGTACRSCRAIVDGWDPFGQLDERKEIHEGYPDWWEGERW